MKGNSTCVRMEQKKEVQSTEKNLWVCLKSWEGGGHSVLCLQLFKNDFTYT